MRLQVNVVGWNIRKEDIGMEQEQKKKDSGVGERLSTYAIILEIASLGSAGGTLAPLPQELRIILSVISIILLVLTLINIYSNNRTWQLLATIEKICLISTVLILTFSFLGKLLPNGCGIKATPTPVPTTTPMPPIPDPSGKIAAGNDFSMLLRNDRKVVTYGKATDIDTTTWENIIQISAYKDHAIGLREDRTVLVTGKDVTEYDVSDWSGIRQVVACKDCVVGVTMDGGIVLAGPNRSCMLDSQKWKSIHRILGAACIVVAERNDGSLIAVDEYEVTEPYMTNLEHRIVSGTAVDNRMLFVLDNGRVKATGKSSVLENIVATWTDMQQVALGNEFAVGLRKNGTVVSIGVPANEKLDVFGWKDVKAICVGGTHVLGLCQDGTILTGGSESGGLADIAGENYWVSK
jgi:hypothetical protein